MCFHPLLAVTVLLFRGETAGGVDSEHIHQSHFSVGYSTRKLGQLYGVVAETSKPCLTNSVKRLCSLVGRLNGAVFLTLFCF